MNKQSLMEQELNPIIEKYMKDQGIPGIAIGIVKDGELLLAKGYGYGNCETKKPITEKSIFHMASVSKTFVATAIIQLYEKGIIDIDKPIVDYIPYFKSVDERYKKITIKHMLSHTSGITYVDDSCWGKGPYDDGALERYVRSLTELELMWEPGSRFYYNNTLYEVLGHLISKMSDMTFEDYIKKNILQPIEMYKSTFFRKEADSSLTTSPHVMTSKTETNIKISEVYPYNRMHAPSSTLHSNVCEMCNFGMTYLNKGLYKDSRIFDEMSYKLIFTPFINFNRNNQKTEIGLTWFMNDYKGHRVFSHSGSDEGFNTKIAFIPDANSFVVYLCNCDFSNVDAISNLLLDIVLGYEPKPLKISVNKELIKAINDKGIKGATSTIKLLKDNDKYIVRESDLNYLGFLYMSENKLDEAIGIFKMALEIFPNSSSIYNSMGECYMKIGDIKCAVESYKKAYGLNPGDFVAKKTINKFI